MHIVITGGAGFLGAELARRILSRRVLRVDGGPERVVRRLTLVDRVAPPADVVSDDRVRVVDVDLRDLSAGEGASGLLDGVDLIFHLAAAVSAECEADFDLGMSMNLDGSVALLQVCRRLGTAPVVVFASSLAVFGAWPGQSMPDVITDTTLPTPRSSYGIQKFIVEQLVADYTRKGFVRGRSVRLMTVSVRPGRPNGAASSFLSGIIREPLAGLPAVCPVPGNLQVILSSPERTLDGLLMAAATSGDDWGPPIAVNLPGLTVSVGEFIQALGRVAGQAAVDRVEWTPDPAIATIVGGWPARFDPGRARRLGLTADVSADAIVRQYLDRVVPSGGAT